MCSKEPPKERLKRLMRDGKKLEATSPKVNILQKPVYLDEARFKRAQKTCQKYYANISVASSTGLMLLLQVDSILIPLAKTGKSKTVADLHDRYLATAKYIKACYDTDFYNQDSDGWKSIMMVRHMHQRIFKFMNDNHPINDSNLVWINQYDMALTQFAFMGLFILNPIKCGAYHINETELMDICYYWRIISYYFGIEEEFNLFSYDDYEKQLSFLKEIFQHFKQTLNNSRNQLGKQMAEGFTFAFEDFTSESTFNILDHWWSPFVSISGNANLTPYSLVEIWKLIFFLLYFKVLFRIEIIRATLNGFYKKKFEKFCKNSPQIKKKLAIKYNYLIFE